jgi:small subunit ribosomal protein S17
MERNQRSSFQGIVVSRKMSKTIVVLVETHKKHAKYGKRVKYGKRYYAHDEKDVANVGDTVTIIACRPISKTKRFRLVSVDKKAVESIKVAEAELKLEEQVGLADLNKKEVKKVDEIAAEVKVIAEAVKEEVVADAVATEIIKDEEVAKPKASKAKKEDKKEK